MTLDFRNINTLWSSIIVETLAKLGLKNAIISPGSRSTPLTLAFAQNNLINSIPILDERSASFFALGLAKKNKIPTVLICTSGTAGANFYPAIIEAKYSNIPLIILTADRPPELRNCHGGQTINQVNLYGNYPNWHTELSLPSTDLERLFYLRQNIIYSWEKSCFPSRGIVHINIPFREPLAPVSELEISEEKKIFIYQQLFANFTPINHSLKKNNLDLKEYLKLWQSHSKGIIIAGIDSPDNPQLYSEAMAFLSQLLNFPVLGEALSPVRNFSIINENLIINYDVILRNLENANNLIPEIVILFGEYPTSKQLRNWLNDHKIKTYIITTSEDNLDALHTNSIHLRINPENFSKYLINFDKKATSNYLYQWLKIDDKITINVNEMMNEKEEIFEAKVAWMLSQYLPEKTPIFIANSMSVRYAEFFWQKNNRQIQTYFSRGTNGIEGTLSTALGIAYQNKPTVLLTGDLALLHDTNGFLINQYLEGSLTIILINNNGGGIFEMLPIADCQPLFEKYFATPQLIDFTNLTKTYNVDYKLINNWQQLQNLLTNLPEKGINLWEIKTNRKNDTIWLKDYFSFFIDS
ncbi:MAG: 2-succinyl-5-enolpyruvyl-6-hydroxy-3-cyclohexene-1-carboxylic-acid synthase [Cyanobacteria bacterium]|nr:2-succinyl-5-enolpyruvyl-6-hydroxy-3-cyclohexene-1-carboxylic-acid synthase [Cyanobacteria bacterium CG_2015-16_32_12]NCO76940.1 2-succinyl-5-enolpyruvyl-6-hydroxy-3-cyclohexene-1-carboxylic-acid synthase [Cyanobacteria bacterium CG_2015-22_32_23]NCS84974.1 2-succinyl-5-enolpyruvyl-6-hydroxy-3-cyclohexene-1-carboxylic-acid synthase [Cyanobacteria bacterium CG_2015-02_32_10]